MLCNVVPSILCHTPSASLVENNADHASHLKFYLKIRILIIQWVIFNVKTHAHHLGNPCSRSMLPSAQSIFRLNNDKHNIYYWLSCSKPLCFPVALDGVTRFNWHIFNLVDISQTWVSLFGSHRSIIWEKSIFPCNIEVCHRSKSPFISLLHSLLSPVAENFEHKHQFCPECCLQNS